jgi:hypothetical protein
VTSVTARGVALTELAENDIAGGKEYVQTDRGKSMVRKLANDPSLKPGNGSWFYKTKEKRPKRRTPTVSTLSDRRSIIIRAKPQTCVEAMVKIIEGFPDRLAATDAYDRIEAGLAGRFPFDRKGKRDQNVSRARKRAGFGLAGRMWVRTRRTRCISCYLNYAQIHGYVDPAWRIGLLGAPLATHGSLPAAAAAATQHAAPTVLRRRDFPSPASHSVTKKAAPPNRKRPAVTVWTEA